MYPKHASIKQATLMMSSCYMQENHGITLRCLTQVPIPITQILQCRALKYKVLLISLDTLHRLVQMFLSNCCQGILKSGMTVTFSMGPDGFH